MKKNKSLLLIFVLIAPAVIWFLMQDDKTTLKDVESDFAISDTASVTKIFIADKNDNSVLLERISDGWILNDVYNTNTKVVDFLLGTLHRIKVKSPVPIVARDNVIKRLASVGIKVEIYQQDFRINIFDKYKFFPYEKLSKVIYIGGATPNNLGTYMLIEGAEHPFVTHIPGFRGFLSPYFSPLPDDWKSHQVFNHNLSDISSVSLEINNKPEESFRVDIDNSDGGYRLQKFVSKEVISRFDTLRLLNFLTSFSDLRYESRLNNIMSPMRIDSILQLPFLFKLTLVDDMNDTIFIKGFTKRALPEEIRDEEYYKLIPDDKDRFYALINGGEDFVLMQYYSFDKVLYPLSYYAGVK